MSERVVYAVRNREGLWFHRMGYGGGGGKSWVPDFFHATLYRTLSQARSRVTFFAKKWPEFGVPVIVAFGLEEIQTHDEKERVTKSISKIEARIADYERRRQAWERARPHR